MSALLQLEIIAGLSVVLVTCAVSFAVLQTRAVQRNATARRSYLKKRARKLP